MKKEQGFSLIELLIVVAIIAIIAAIAVPSMLQARMAANEAGAIQGCRTVGSAEVAFAAINNQNYTNLAGLQTGGFLDSRFFTGSLNGYQYTDATTIAQVDAAQVTTPGGFGVSAAPESGKGRYTYGIASDQVVRWLSGTPTPLCGASNCAAGDPIGTSGSGS